MVGKVRVPADLPEGVRWVFAEHLSMPEAYGLSAEDLAALRGLRPLRHYNSGYIRVDATELKHVRELAAVELAELECACADSLALCERCRVVALAKRIDCWLVKESAHDGGVTPEAELTWEHMYGGRTVAV